MCVCAYRDFCLVPFCFNLYIFSFLFLVIYLYTIYYYRVVGQWSTGVDPFEVKKAGKTFSRQILARWERTIGYRKITLMKTRFLPPKGACISNSPIISTCET